MNFKFKPIFENNYYFKQNNTLYVLCLITLLMWKDFQHLIARNNAWFIFILIIHFLEWIQVYHNLQLASISSKSLAINFVHLLFFICFLEWNFHTFVFLPNAVLTFRNDHDTFYHISLFFHSKIGKDDLFFPHSVFVQRKVLYRHQAFLLSKQ